MRCAFGCSSSSSSSPFFFIFTVVGLLPLSHLIERRVCCMRVRHVCGGGNSGPPLAAPGRATLCLDVSRLWGPTKGVVLLGLCWRCVLLASSGTGQPGSAYAYLLSIYAFSYTETAALVQGFLCCRWRCASSENPSSELYVCDMYCLRSSTPRKRSCESTCRGNGGRSLFPSH